MVKSKLLMWLLVATTTYTIVPHHPSSARRKKKHTRIRPRRLKQRTIRRKTTRPRNIRAIKRKNRLVRRQIKLYQQETDTRLSTVIMFDLHGVLTKTNLMRAAKKFLKIPHKIHFLKSAWQGELARCISTADPEYQREMVKTLNQQTIQPAVVSIVKELKDNGYKLILFSNICPQALDNLREDPDFAYLFSLFDAFALNGIQTDFSDKPSPKAFAHAKKIALQVNPRADSFILIDDTKSHLLAAQKYGIKSIHFKSEHQLRKVLTCMHFLR